MATIIVNPQFVDPATPYASGGGEYAVGSTATLEAHTATGYYFSHWADGAGRLIYDNPLNVKVHDGTESYTAYFSVQPSPEPHDEGEDQPGTRPQYTVTVECEHPGEGIVTGGGVYLQGSSCQITAAEDPATPQHKFVGWKNPAWDNPNGKVFKQSSYTFDVFDDETFIAIFDDMGPEGYPDWTTEDENEYEERKKQSRKTIRVYVDPVPAYEGDNSTATGGGTFYAGETCTLTATADTSIAHDNHFVIWKRTEENSATSPALEFRTENPYSFQVYSPDQYWWAIFGTGLTRVTVSTNLQLNADGSQGGAVWLEFDHALVQDAAYCSSPYDDKLRAGTFLRHDVVENLVIKYEEWFMRPQQNGDIGIWMPEYIVERKSKRKIYLPSGDVKSWFFNDVSHYMERTYVALSYYDCTPLVDDGAIVDLYVHFVQVGFILRESSGNILRNNTNILRGNG